MEYRLNGGDVICVRCTAPNILFMFNDSSSYSELSLCRYSRMCVDLLSFIDGSHRMFFKVTKVFLKNYFHI